MSASPTNGPEPGDEHAGGGRALLWVVFWLAVLGGGVVAGEWARGHRFDELGPPLLIGSIIGMIIGFAGAGWTIFSRRQAIVATLAGNRSTRIVTGSTGVLLGLGLLGLGGYLLFTTDPGRGRPPIMTALLAAVGVVVAWWSLKLLARRR